MSKKFDIISMILIIALTVILVVFVFNYFTSSELDKLSPVNSNLVVNTDIVENVSGSNALITNTPVVEQAIENVDKDTTIIVEKEPGDTNVNRESGDSIIKDVYEQPKENPREQTPLIITSNDNISDKEKKEVLNELDETLMDLLDVIETVQIVDESRLPTVESEVQP